MKKKPKKPIKCLKIRVKDKKIVAFLKEKIFQTKHFENMLLILLKQDYDHNEGRHQKMLLDGDIIRAMISNTAGSKDKVEDIKYMKMYYKEHQLMQDLLSVGRELKTHNLVEQIKDVKKNYQGFFTKRQQGDTEARPPKPKALSNLGNYQAGLDIGVNELAAIFTNHPNSNGLIVDGKRFKLYNNGFNRKSAKITQDIDDLLVFLETKEELCEGLDIQSKVDYLRAYKRYLNRKRDQFFESEFHKVSKRILEYLYLNGVSTLVVSSSLGQLKTNGNCEMHSKVKQSFIQIPFMKLIHQLKEKAPQYGILIKDVNESYTSKTSSLSSTINEIKTLAFNKTLTTDDFKGSRVKRGLFKDKELKKTIHADMNGAKNILQIVTNQFEGYTNKQLCNPIKIKSDHEFLALVKNSQVG